MDLLVICADFPVRKKTAEATLLANQLNIFNKIFKRIYILPTVDINKKDIVAGKDYNIISKFRHFDLKLLKNFFSEIRYLIEDFKLGFLKNYNF